MAGNKVILTSQSVHTGHGPPFAGWVEVTCTKITGIGSGDYPGKEYGSRIDLGGNRLVPGLIDLHIHGSGGLEITSPDEQVIPKIGLFLAKHGTVAWQPTTGAVALEDLDKIIELVKGYSSGFVNGARVLGLHMEGPFLNPKKKGAMSEKHLKMPSMELMAHWIKLGGGCIKQVTIAPELAGASQVIKYLAEQGITVSAGHTDASYEQMLKAFGEGVTVGTHTFNAMRGLHHREPGAVGALLTQKDIVCELIADGIHVHPGAMKLLIQCKGYDEVCLVSDAGPPAGLKSGTYTMLGRTISVDESGKCLLPDGTIAGSAATMMLCLKNVVQLLDIPFDHALKMATLVPARLAGVEACKGSLKVGKDADLVAIDMEYNVVFSMVEGEILKKPS
jgi:N-acetylglucosamine-6-phosphate deacetylase